MGQHRHDNAKGLYVVTALFETSHFDPWLCRTVHRTSAIKVGCDCVRALALMSYSLRGWDSSYWFCS